MLNRTILALAAAPLLTLAAPQAFAQDAPAPLNTERMVEAVAAEADTGKFMGAVLVAKGDEKVLDRAWGSADLEWDIANTTDTKFRIGSVTKQFTAVSILLLQEQGKLTLDDPISKHLKDTPEAWSALTVRQILRHTAGLPNVTNLDSFGDVVRDPISQDELIGMFKDLPLEFEPGSSWKYSNSGYVLASKIVENVSGETLSDFYQANIFDPLGMAATGLDVSATILPKRADGYSPTGDDKTVMNAPYADMGIPTGAGAMYSTTGDLMKWQRGLFGGKVLSEESLAEYVTTTGKDAFRGSQYAHGVMVFKEDGNTAYSHGGGIQGFNAWLAYDPDREVTVVVLANLNGGAATKLGMQLTTLAQGGEVTLPGDRKVANIAADDLAQYEGTFALTPSFKIKMFVEDGKLMTQATGQGANEMFYEGDDRFFLKVVDAQVRFNRDEAGAINSITLFQNGREIPGPKE